MQSYLIPDLHKYLDYINTARKEILTRIFKQVWKMIRYLNKQWRLQLAPEVQILSRDLTTLVMILSDSGNIKEPK